MITSPWQVDSHKYGTKLEQVVKRIEAHLSNKFVHVNEYDGRRMVQFELSVGEYWEPALRQLVKKVYEDNGWASVEFPTSERVEFIFPEITL